MQWAHRCCAAMLAAGVGQLQSAPRHTAGCGNAHPQTSGVQRARTPGVNSGDARDQSASGSCRAQLGLDRTAIG